MDSYAQSSCGFTFYAGRVSPFTTVNKAGYVSGAAVDVVEELMKMTKFPIDVSRIRNISWARAVEETETKPGSVLFCVARTPQRENRFKWVGPIADLNLGLLSKRESRIVIKDKEDLARYRIGVIRNSGPVDILEQQYGIPKANMTMLSTNELQFRMLMEGRVDMITQADTSATSWLKKMRMKPDNFKMVYLLKRLHLYMAFNLETDDVIIKEFQSALDEMKKPKKNGISRYDELVDKYFEHGLSTALQ